MRNDCVESALRSSGENLQLNEKKAFKRFSIKKQKQKAVRVAFQVLFQRISPLSLLFFVLQSVHTHTRTPANALLFRASHGDDDEGNDKNRVRNRDARSLRFLE